MPADYPGPCQVKLLQESGVAWIIDIGEEEREDLVVQFAIPSSPEHRWWFTPHPDHPLATKLSTPRFYIPKSEKVRDEKRPIIKYTQVLNNLSEDE